MQSPNSPLTDEETSSLCSKLNVNKTSGWWHQIYRVDPMNILGENEYSAKA